MSEQTTNPMSPHGLIARTLAARANPRMAGETAAIRQGLLLATEIHARPYTDLYLTGEHEKAAAGWRRGAAICAASPGVRQPGPGKRVPLGASLRMLYDKGNPGRPPQPGNAIVAQVNSLPMLDLDNAAITLALLVNRCSIHGIPVDFHGLGRVLSRWGRGTRSRSRAVRNQIINDFYMYDRHNTEDTLS